MTFPEFTASLHPLASITLASGHVFTAAELGAETYAGYTNSLIAVPAQELPDLLTRLISRDFDPQQAADGSWSVQLAPGVQATIPS